MHPLPVQLYSQQIRMVEVMMGDGLDGTDAKRKVKQ